MPDTIKLIIDTNANRVVLASPAFTFTLDTAAGLRAVAWENRLTGRTLDLGRGPEVEFDLGFPDQPLVTPTLRVTGLPAVEQAASGEAVFRLESDQPAARVTVTYRWSADAPVLRKFVVIENTGSAAWNRLLNVRLGQYATGEAALAGGELKPWPETFRDRAHKVGGLQGFPVYADDEFFLSLAHPAGWATQKPGEIRLGHYPGAVLQPGESRPCMETVYGVGAAGQGRAAFVAQLRGRMRRVRRGHDKPYAIFETFGGRVSGESGPPGNWMNQQIVPDSGPHAARLAEARLHPVDAAYAKTHLFDENEPYVLDILGKLAEGQRGKAGKFDFASIEFWVDHQGDITRADPERFPNQFAPITAALDRAGMHLGLWIGSSTCGWSIGGNPAIRPALMEAAGPEFFAADRWTQYYAGSCFCRATEPARSMYTDGFLHHIRANGVRLVKFDDCFSQCSNPAHAHLPGIYGNEATIEGTIDCYRALDAACPELFIILYWGYRSPWWLLFGDTIFETGVEMEACSPGHMPAPFVRNAVIRKIDQGRVYARDLPALGSDTLGIWLSHWGGWNNGIGTEHWQDGFVMDICRGHALAQLWTDPDWLTPPERRQVHEFIALMKSNPVCFTNGRLLFGDPWKNEPYGYGCSDGRRAFLAVNNGTWEDREITLDFGPAWGLPANRRWDLHRWHPAPARLTGPAAGFGAGVRLALRAFEVMLLEVVPHGEPPSLGKTFAAQPLPTGFAEASRAIPVTVTRQRGVAAGSLALPMECEVFSPCTMADGLPSPEAMRGAGSGLEVSGRRLEGQRVRFMEDRVLDLAAFAGPAPSPTTPVGDSSRCSWIRIPFTVATPENAVFGFGADWWYEAWLDGVLLSETLSCGGNRKTPIDILNHRVTVPLAIGPHLLMLRHFRGAGAATLAVAGPGDFLETSICGESPASRGGGLLVVVVELVGADGQPVEAVKRDSFSVSEASLGGVPVEAERVHRAEFAAASWQAWRIAIPPGAPDQPFALRLLDAAQPAAERRCSAYFLPA